MLQRDPSYGFLLIYHLIAECQIIYNIYVIIIYEIYVVYRSILQCLIIFPHLLYLFSPHESLLLEVSSFSTIVELVSM